MDITNVTILSVALLTNSVATNKTDETIALSDGSVGKISKVLVVEGGVGKLEFSLDGQRVGVPFQFIIRWRTNNVLGEIVTPSTNQHPMRYPIPDHPKPITFDPP